MPATLLLSTWLWESAWFYMVLCAVVAVATPDANFDLGITLAPYGMGILVTLLLSTLSEATRDRSLQHSAPSTQHSALSLLLTVAIALLQLAGCALCLLGVTWWELYRSQPLLDVGWLEMARSDAQHSLSALPAAGWLIVTCIFLWWRGSSVSRQEVDFQGLVYRFMGGTALLLVIAALGADLPQSPSLSTPILGGYLLFGLMAMSGARLEAAGRERQGAVDERWRRRSSAMAVLLLAIGFGLAFLLLPLLGTLAGDIAALVTNVLWPRFLDLLRAIIHLLGLDKPPAPLPAEPVPGPSLSQGQRDLFFTLSEEVRNLGRFFFNLCWVIIFVYSIYLWVRRWVTRPRRRGTAGATREKIPWEWSPMGILRALLRMLLAKWPSLSRWIGRAVAAEDRSWTIRELYRKMERWGAARGQNRSPWSTPWEYQIALSAQWPELKEGFQTITDSFLRARYGGAEVKGEELEAAAREWGRIASAPSHTPTAR